MKVNEAKGGDSSLGIRKSVTAKELKYTDSFTPPPLSVGAGAVVWWHRNSPALLDVRVSCPKGREALSKNGSVHISILIHVEALQYLTNQNTGDYYKKQSEEGTKQGSNKPRLPVKKVPVRIGMWPSVLGIKHMLHSRLYDFQNSISMQALFMSLGSSDQGLVPSAAFSKIGAQYSFESIQHSR